MHRTLLLLLCVALTTSAAAAPNETAVDPVMDDVQETLDNTIPDLPDPIEGITDEVSVGDRISDGLADAGRFVGQLIAATFTGLALAGAAAAAGLGAAASGLANGTAAALEGVGRGVGIVFSTIGGGIASLAGLYAGFVASLRPEAMSPIAFGAVATTGGAASAGAGSWAGWSVLKKWGWVGSGLGGIGGFSRIADSELLDHPVRGQLFTTIQEHPGIHASQLARDVGVGWGTVSHHLDKLRKGQLVTSRKVNNQQCFFENGGAVSRSDMEVAGAVKGDTAGRIAAFVHSSPMTSQKQLAEALGISPALASFHVKKLTNLGVLEKMRHGKETLLTTSQAMQHLLASDRNLLASLEARQVHEMDYSA